MDHTEATRELMTERYLLGELSPAQKDAFEEHFFSCGECAEAVAQGAYFVDNARAALAEQRPAAVPPAVIASQSRWLQTCSACTPTSPPLPTLFAMYARSRRKARPA